MLLDSFERIVLTHPLVAKSAGSKVASSSGPVKAYEC